MGGAIGVFIYLLQCKKRAFFVLFIRNMFVVASFGDFVFRLEYQGWKYPCSGASQVLTTEESEKISLLYVSNGFT